MEKFLFKKIELWVLGLVLVAAFLGMILFGAIVLDEERGEEELGGDNFGPIGDAALALAEIPENARQAFKRVGELGSQDDHVALLHGDKTLAAIVASRY